MQEMNGKKAVIYARQSFTKEESSASIQQQIENCRQWCEKNSIEIVAVFSDENTSSELYDDSIEGHAYAATDAAWLKWDKEQRTKGRKKYKKHLAAAFELLPNVDFFVTNERTRLYRNPSPLAKLDLYILSKLKENNVALVEVESNKIDYIDNDIDIAVHRLLATYEMKKLSERRSQSMNVIRAKKERGITFSNAFGTLWDAKNKVLSFDNEKAEVIKYVFDSVIENKTYAEILHTLNTKYIHLATGKCFYESSIYNIIKNISYCGMRKNAEGNVIKCINVKTPVVSYLQYKKANEIVKDKKLKSGRQKYNIKGNAKRHFLPLSGYLKCGHCGSKLVMVNDKGIVYFCKKTILLHDKNCSSSRIRLQSLSSESDLLLTLQALFAIRVFHYEYEKKNYTSSSKDDFIVERDNLRTKMQSVLEQFVKLNLNEDIFKKQIEEYNERLKELNEKILEAEALENSKEDKEFQVLREKLDKIEFTEELLDHDSFCTLLRETVKEIVVYSDKMKIVLFDDVSFELPRILKKYKSKDVPLSSVKRYLVKNKIFNVVNFYQDSIDSKEYNTLVKKDYYEIRLYK